MLYSFYRRVNITTSNPAIVNTMKSIALRSIGHAITSSVAAMCYLFVAQPYGAALYGIILPLGMHFWFNSNWWLWKRVPATGLRMTRSLRENLALAGKLTTVARQLRLIEPLPSEENKDINNHHHHHHRPHPHQDREQTGIGTSMANAPIGTSMTNAKIGYTNLLLPTSPQQS
jgi:hypothetical protein